MDKFKVSDAERENRRPYEDHYNDDPEEEEPAKKSWFKKKWDPSGDVLGGSSTNLDEEAALESVQKIEEMMKKVEKPAEKKTEEKQEVKTNINESIVSD